MRTVDDFSPVESLTMCSGVGDFSKSACVVAQAAILDALMRGETLTEPTDELDCACPVLRVLAIGMNDIKWWESDQERTETLRPLLGALLDSRVGADAISKRASLASGFAEYAAESAAKSAKPAKSAEYAKYAAKYAAEYAAESAAESAKSAEYAKYAADAAEYAAESAKYAKYAADAAKSAAKYAAESAAGLKELRAKMLECFWACEAIKDEVNV